MTLDRREFLTLSAGFAGAMGFPPHLFRGGGSLLPPLDPDRGWERLYREQYRTDSSFTCAFSPDDAPACRARLFVRNGVVVRAEATGDVQRTTDLQGRKAPAGWGPRISSSIQLFPRRLHGPYRLRGPLVRKGWKEWADDGFPYLTPELRAKYRFDSRGSDALVPASWDDALGLAARGLVAIAKQYSGDEGRRRLIEEGYLPEAVDAAEGSGVRCMKFGGGPGLPGLLGRQGMARFSNMLALLDSLLRGVAPGQAKGGRLWAPGDVAAPGHAFVHGLQASDTDFNELRHARLLIHAGSNLVEAGRVDAPWAAGATERGAVSWNLSTVYGPSSLNVDHWLPLRPQTEAAIFLHVAKHVIDTGRMDSAFVLRHTDLPLLVRTDTLRRLNAKDLGLPLKDLKGGPGVAAQGLSAEQRERIGDFAVWDTARNAAVAISRDDVGPAWEKLGIKPALEGRYSVKIGGKDVEVAPLLELYKLHLKDYDLDTVVGITGAPKALVQKLAEDVATIKPCAIHVGEGVNQGFHATEINRAAFLPLLLTGNVGVPGGGCFTWGGGLRPAIFQASPDSGAGLAVYGAEDPFAPVADPAIDGKELRPQDRTKDESPVYWSQGDRPLVVDTPKAGRKVFTGASHMPTPTKVLWVSGGNPVNDGVQAYELVRHVLPKTSLLMITGAEMTASVEYADIAWPANLEAELQQLEFVASSAAPFLQIWGGKGLKPLHDSRDAVMILAAVAKAVGDAVQDPRFAAYWSFALEGKPEVYLQRILDASSTTRGYKVADILAGKHGEPGEALLNFRSSPRRPFSEMVGEGLPFHTPTGRLQAYNDEPEVIEYGENFIVHREGPEATPFLPNAIVSTNPLVRPESYGIPETETGADARQVRNLKKSWAELKEIPNPLWKKGYRFHFLLSRSRHAGPPGGSAVDWSSILDSNFGDPYRPEKRTPFVGEQQLHVNPEAARDLGFDDGDYVYVDADPAGRPYAGWKLDDPFGKVGRLMLRVRFNPACPYTCVMAAGGGAMATERSVKAQEARPDGRTLSEGTGYQALHRSGSPQSCTRPWLMPMQQIDSLLHKSAGAPSFLFGAEAGSLGIVPAPREALVRISKAEDGGLNGNGLWAGGLTGRAPGGENWMFQRYLEGGMVVVSKD